MRMNFLKLRKIIRQLVLESLEEESDLPYEETLMPGEEGVGVLGGPDFSEQPKRNDYLEKKKDNVKKKKAKLHSQEEIERDSDDEGVSDEHAIVGAIGPMGAGNGPGRKPYQKQRKLKSKNAMSISKALDEYDE